MFTSSGGLLTLPARLICLFPLAKVSYLYSLVKWGISCTFSSITISFPTHFRYCAIRVLPEANAAVPFALVDSWTLFRAYACLHGNRRSRYKSLSNRALLIFCATVISVHIYLYSEDGFARKMKKEQQQPHIPFTWAQKSVCWEIRAIEPCVFHTYQIIRKTTPPAACGFHSLAIPC